MKIKLLVLLSFVGLAHCGESSVSVNVKNAINTISDRFISYEIDFFDLMDLTRGQKLLGNISSSSPSYIKLKRFSNYLKDDQVRKYNESDVASLLQALRLLQITPVIVIDYTILSFEPINLLKDLKKARDMNIVNCVWQLGDSSLDLADSFSVKKYSDDLKTLKILCESVNKDHHLNWDVAAVGSLLKKRGEKLPFDVAGFDIEHQTPGEILSKSTSVSFKSQTPMWATIEHSPEKTSEEFSVKSKTNETCDDECLSNGLLFAQVLGNAAKKGIDVLFFDEPIAKSSRNSNSFKLAVAKLHKKLIGNKVFNVRVTKSSPDGKLMNLYSYCSKKTNGAITLMGINYSNMRAKFNVKISSPIDADAVILQYLLSASDGHVMLNNVNFNADATPATKFKKITKFSIALVLPPFSMAFWTVKNAKVNECLNVEVAGKNAEVVSQAPSSADQLLKQLVANEFDGRSGNMLEKQKRSKRQISPSTQFLPKFELESLFKFPNLMTSGSTHKPIKDVFFNKNTEVYRVAPIDANPLQSSENPSLPKGDVYLLVNDGKDFFSPGNVDYVTDDNVEPRRPKSSRKKNPANRIVYKETTEAPEYFMPYDYVDASYKEKAPKKSKSKPAKTEQPTEIGELFEAERSSNPNGRSSDQMRGLSSNVELQTVVKELEPTYRQSKTALLAAKRKWDKSQIMELLKDSQLEEVDKAQFPDGENFEYIDLTKSNDAANYDDYEEEDDDGFFSDEKPRHIRTKRAVDYSKNEIPKYGGHFIDEDEDSLESLMDDVHLFLPPRTDNGDAKNHQESTTKISRPVEPPLTVKAVDFFSKSLTDVLNVAQRTFVGWWYVFNPTETM